MEGNQRTALCWEMAGGANGVEGWRFIVADRFLLVQERPVGNERPLWLVSDHGTVEEATESAVAQTQALEDVYGARLLGEPFEVLLHDSEFGALREGGRIPPPLRARVFTAMRRRVPQPVR